MEPSVVTTDCAWASTYALTSASSSWALTCRARPNALRRKARSRHSGVGCSQAPRPGNRSRGSATTLAMCSPASSHSATTLAAMLIDHRDDGNPRTYVSHVGLAADGYVATDRSPPLYRLALTVRASMGLRSTLIVHRRGVRTDVDAPSGELGGQARILTFLADRQRQLVVGDGHPGRTHLQVDDLDRVDPRR